MGCIVCSNTYESLGTDFVYFLKNKRNIECAVCLEIFNKKDKCIMLPCNHYFHKKCYNDWEISYYENWKISKIPCPLCRNNKIHP